LDRDVIPVLQRAAEAVGQLQIFQGDALRFDYCSTIPAGGKLRLVGNLPYNISTPLLFYLLDQKHCIRDMHFMLQKEVVLRMAAAPGGRDYGRLSVMLQAATRVEHLFDIGKGAFRPPPRVESSFVRLIPHAEPPFPISDTRRFAAVVMAAFSQRRKTLRNSLKKLLSEQQIRDAGIDPAARAETLSPAEFGLLANVSGGSDSELGL
jgi:16S rRNA (adenine1518-N6/adenine1519-N6)-dimethyltransferase